MKFVVIDDSKVFATLFQDLLGRAGHSARTVLDSTTAFEDVADDPPDGVLLDLMMPNVDGFELLRQFRADHRFDDVRIIIVTAKPYDVDRRLAMSLGADGYINKNTAADEIIDRINTIMEDAPKAKFWGVRGTMPVPGEGSLRFGGNTSCVSLELPSGQIIVFDGGSGMKRCGDHYQAIGKGQFDCVICISHPHWDHINAIPFFAPLYGRGNTIDIYGAAQNEKSVEDLIAGQMDGVYFPVTVSEFAAHVRYHNIAEGSYTIGGAVVTTMLLNHPGRCLAYRVEYGGTVFIYATDQELYPPTTPHYNQAYRDQLIEFWRDADVVITDTTYTAAEYKSKVHWGHSSVEQVVDVAHQAGVKTLCLFHHDPDQDDAAIEAKLAIAEHRLSELESDTAVIAPAEGAQLLIR